MLLWPIGGVGRGPAIVHDLVERKYTKLARGDGGDYCWHAFTPDDRFVIIKFGNEVSIREVRTGRKLIEKVGGFEGTTVAAAGQSGQNGANAGIILVGRPLQGLQLWRWVSLPFLRGLRMTQSLGAPGATVKFAAFAKGGTQILTIAEDGKAMVYNQVDGGAFVGDVLFQCEAGVVEVKVTPDLSRALIQTQAWPIGYGQPTFSVKLWDMQRADLVKDVGSGPTRILMDLSPDGKSVVTCSEGTARLELQHV